MAGLPALSKEEVAKRAEAAAAKGAAVFCLHGRVFEVSGEYFDEHPGGKDVLVAPKGADVSADWDDVRHSKNARRTLQKYVVGTVAGGDAPEGAANPTHPDYEWPEEKAWREREAAKKQAGGGFNLAQVLAAGVALLAIVYFNFMM